MLNYFDVIKAQSGVPVDDIWAQLWGNTLSSEYVITTYTGTLPATLTGTKAGYLESYTIYGNTVQDGTPTPSSPIYPSECGVRTENLYNYRTDTPTNNKYINPTDGGEISAAGWQATSFIPIGSDTVTLSNVGGQDPGICLYDVNKEYLAGVRYNTSGAANPIDVTISAAGAKYARFSYAPVYAPPETLILVAGSTAPDHYIPYGYKLPLTLGSTTTDIYLGEVQSTRRIKKLVLTGEEGWRRTANEKCYYIDLANGCPNDYLKQLTTTSICSHYQSQNNTASGSNEVDAGHFCFYIGGGFELYIGETTISSATDFKSYLQQQYANGTPVTVWYTLTTPTTGILNEPLRKIGDYSDTLGMEQAGVSIPTAAGSTTISWAGEGLAPSQVELEYKARR